MDKLPPNPPPTPDFSDPYVCKAFVEGMAEELGFIFPKETSLAFWPLHFLAILITRVARLEEEVSKLRPN